MTADSKISGEKPLAIRRNGNAYEWLEITSEMSLASYSYSSLLSSGKLAYDIVNAAAEHVSSIDKIFAYGRTSCFVKFSDNGQPAWYYTCNKLANQKLELEWLESGIDYIDDVEHKEIYCIADTGKDILFCTNAGLWKPVYSAFMSFVDD